MLDLARVGDDWITDQLEGLTHEVIHVSPTDYNEQTRYLPSSVTSMPGPLSYNINPFMREIVDCFDIDSPVREVNLKKGVQITYSTAIESGALYYMGHIGSLPIMYITADKELASARIENNFIPMLNHSGLADIIQSSDEGNSRKTGKTANHLQLAKGGYLVPFGAINANKMRAASIAIMLKDEIDAWPEVVGKDGDPDKLSDARCKGFWERRKIFRGSTPLEKSTSKIEKAYLKGDQRKYNVLCKSCSYPQELRWETIDKETGLIGGFQWETDAGVLVLESVRYCCPKCGHAHYEHDKETLFSPDGGAKWVPTARPSQPDIRSYHLPALYSPIGMQPWYNCVADYLEAFDPVARKVKDIGQYQVFYNNILGEPFEVQGAKVRFEQVSAHRVGAYGFGSIPNKWAELNSGSTIQFLTCQVDVHKSNLAVSVFGWCVDAKCYLIDYWRLEAGDDDEADCSEISSPVWSQLRELIEEKVYVADDDKKYNILLTMVDAGWSNDTVVTFCSEYTAMVWPILGRTRAAKNQTIKEFGQWTTTAGTTGYRVTVDHYKDRIASALRREWTEGAGEQKRYHFNAPHDVTDKQLKELTAESRKKKVDPQGGVSYFWDRPGNVANELFDLLGYGHAGVEIIAWEICIQHFELETVDWAQFWAYVADPSNDANFGRS